MMREESSKALSSFQSTPSRGASDVVSVIESRLDRRSFRQHHWEGTFFEYLDIAMERPGVVRNAYQRLHDAILSFGFEKYRLFKRDCIRYHFFSDPIDNGIDAIFGLDFALMQLV